ncbi:hypothetical protein PG994_006766 [Apiospora phragmitis]|uniref:MARVEL domain-containing protein n=1 Tax=Apiospora phragmitis TaxID=2905665 RepID=A0ABR1VG05_9PEZI
MAESESDVASGPSVTAPTNNRNVWANHIKNGDDRTHVPPMSKKVLIVRVVQLVIAVVFLVLAAFAAFTLNMGNCQAFPKPPTAAHPPTLYLPICTKYPVANANDPFFFSSTRVVEGLTNIFWLAAWASLASLASALNVARAGYYYVLTARQIGLIGAGQAQPPPPPPDGGPDGGRGPGGVGVGGPGVGAGGAAAAASAAATARSTIQAAKIAICVDAGLGAVIWVLFIVTLIATTFQDLKKARELKRVLDEEEGSDVAAMTDTELVEGGAATE